MTFTRHCGHNPVLASPASGAACKPTVLEGPNKRAAGKKTFVQPPPDLMNVDSIDALKAQLRTVFFRRHSWLGTDVREPTPQI